MTAEKFLRNKADELNSDFNDVPQWIIDQTVEFAKYHCKQQLEDILMSMKMVTDRDITTQGLVVKITVDNNSIVNAYPLDKIK